MMADHPMKAALRLAQAGEIDEALRLVEEALTLHPICPYLLVLRARLIQLYDGPLPLDLGTVEDSLLKAYAVDKAYIPALYELAEFYDAVASDRSKARHFATLCSERLNQSRDRIAEILYDHDRSGHESE